LLQPVWAKTNSCAIRVCARSGRNFPGWCGRLPGPGVTIVTRSKDLVHWSEEKALPVMAHEPTTANCWAPEIIWDDAQQHYLIYCHQRSRGNFRSRTNRAQGQDQAARRNHRSIRRRRRFFETFTPTRSTITRHQRDDETMVRDGQGWVMFVKNETEIRRGEIYFRRQSSFT